MEFCKVHPGAVFDKSRYIVLYLQEEPNELRNEASI
jgi:hypothetical protein